MNKCTNLGECCYECKERSGCEGIATKPCIYDFISEVNYKRCVHYNKRKTKPHYRG